MTHGDILVLSGMTIAFIIVGISTRKWVLTLLTWLWMIVGTIIILVAERFSVMGAFIIAMGFVIYPVGRSFRE